MWFGDECLPSICEFLSSTPSTGGGGEKKEGKRKEIGLLLM
jgi:hypothetical protein